jgi:outer membrane protein assembly factor BamB
VVVATDRNTIAYDRASKTIEIVAFSAADGTRLWSAKGDCLPNFVFFYHPVDIYVARGQVWGLAEDLEWNAKPGSGNLLGLDLNTGEVRTRIPLEGAFTPGHHVRCYRGKATDNYLLFNKRGIEFVDIATGNRAIQQSWIRGTCRYGILPCNGLIYTPPHACACYPGAQLNGFFALATAGARTETAAPSTFDPLETGPAYKPQPAHASEAAKPHASDWPTYRYDARRTGATPTLVPPVSQPLWQKDIGGRLSAPVAADRRVYVAAIDQHTVHCMAADDGREHWRFTAGGRIDSPPTIVGQLVVFGCRDGWAYCLTAETGQLVWRFCPAPRERLIGAFGQLESVWPLHGSVLAKSSTVYLAAGRSSFLDGGIHLCAVDAASGKERYRTVLFGPDVHDASISKSARHMPGALPDVMTGDGGSVFMRHVRLPADLAGQLTPASFAWGPKAQNQIMTGSGFLDDALFNRTVWQYGNRIDRSQMLVVDGTEVYGLRVYSGISWNCPVYHVGEGHLLFRQNVSKPAPKAPPAPSPLLNRIPYERYRWHTRVPALISAMVLAGARRADAAEKCLFVAGQPDDIDPEDPLAAFEGRKGGWLFALSGETGEVLNKRPLPSPPVWDGMIACRRRLYVSLKNGTLLCLGAPRKAPVSPR